MTLHDESTEERTATALEGIARGLRELGKEGAAGPGAVEALGMSIAGTPPSGSPSLVDAMFAIADNIGRVADALSGIEESIDAARQEAMTSS